jgi:hypothetical protein
MRSAVDQRGLPPLCRPAEHGQPRKRRRRRRGPQPATGVPEEGAPARAEERRGGVRLSLAPSPRLLFLLLCCTILLFVASAAMLRLRIHLMFPAVRPRDFVFRDHTSLGMTMLSSS